jgi:hypothetical protein
MTYSARLSQEARLLPVDERKNILLAIPETELHEGLAELFRSMNSEFWVEVTHGAKEYGKDLVIIRSDPLMTDVTGVVVKRGDIRAKTAGDVDELIERVQGVLTAKGESITREILSQIRQTKIHDAELSSHVRDLKCNRVMVILSGEMSGNARKRIAAEVGPLGVVHDLPWLVETFTAYYPQIFFEARAVDHLYDKINEMEADTFHSKSGKTLTECFVEPVIAPMDRELSFDDATNIFRVKQRRLRFSQLGATLTARRKILLIGDPGSGKSKAVAKFCIDGYRSALNQMTRRERDSAPVGIPIVVSARRFANYGTPEELYSDLLPESVRDRLVAATLVLDGLDELSSNQRESTLQKSEDFAQALGTTLLVTSRRLAAFAVAPRGFSRYEILPFEVGQAMKLVNKVLINKDVLPALKQGIQTIQSQLPMSPLSLILLIEVVAERKEVPASITELYERFLDLVFGRWDQEKGLAVVFEYVVKKRFLATLAHDEFFLKRRLEISAQEFEVFLKAYAAKYGWDEDQIREFTKEIDRAGVLDTQAEVFFRHRSFFDFFIGHHIHEQRAAVPDLTGLVVSTYYDELWMEAAFFFAGLSRDMTDDILDGLFAHRAGDDNADLAVQKFMIGRLLQAGWHSPTATKERGVRQALTYLPGTVKASRDFLKAARRPAPDFFAELLALFLAEHSLGSFAVVNEGAIVLKDLQASGDLSRKTLLERATLLFCLRRHADPKQHSDAVKAFVADLDKAALDPPELARFLVMAGLSDLGSDLRKLIGRRIKRLEKDEPSAISALLPGTRSRFQPPSKR